MKDSQQSRVCVSYWLHMLSHWLTELGRVFIFATTAAIILSFVNQEGLSNFRVILVLAFGGAMMLVGIALEHWLLKKKFNSLNL
ncbi:hypothetical protein [uncultured Pseudoalteromonas sp.]|uniref:hypothetical protein n=1 Tax=uncultured Pseudoalteromonas sp. TaxID=114053 RepID=UPI0025F03905|nr:hypothetical protein [uncultured Pseudoalteromonas sp.]